MLIPEKMDHPALMTKRPFGNPHHTISYIALVGCGKFPQPGDISPGHNGILFIDEPSELKNPFKYASSKLLFSRHLKSTED